MLGSRLGPYRLLCELGTGAMGTVYRATVVDEAPAGIPRGSCVAIKVIHPHLLRRPGYARRFLREVRIGQRVTHPNVVRTYEGGSVPEGRRTRLYLVMECVEGRTLRAMLDSVHRLPETKCRHVGREVARALQAIHEAGVVHRDVKPENILVGKHDEVKVMDMGIARLRDEAFRLSQAGLFRGSIEYAAPEQFRAGGTQVDGRADLHALGATLYEMATGRHPFGTGDIHGVLRRILDEDPPRARRWVPGLSPFFDEVLATLLAKDPAQRFRTARLLAEVLEEGEASSWWLERSTAPVGGAPVAPPGSGGAVA